MTWCSKELINLDPELKRDRMRCQLLHVPKIVQWERRIVFSPCWLKQGTNMADTTLVLEGSLKHRDGKKVFIDLNACCHDQNVQQCIVYPTHIFRFFQWKSRWCMVRKYSPVAGRLVFILRSSESVSGVTQLSSCQNRGIICQTVSLTLILPLTMSSSVVYVSPHWINKLLVCAVFSTCESAWSTGDTRWINPQ